MQVGRCGVRDGNEDGWVWQHGVTGRWVCGLQMRTGGCDGEWWAKGRLSYVPLYVRTACICPSSTQFVTDSRYVTWNEKRVGVASRCGKGCRGIVGDQCMQAGR